MPVTVPPTAKTAYVPLADTLAWTRKYADPAISSRTTPADDVPWRDGTWRIDDSRLLYGREIEELSAYHPLDLTPTEFEWNQPEAELRYGGKLSDAQRYARWMEQGIGTAPPIHVVEADCGELRVTEGHRRLYASNLVGVPVRAWVSWSADHPRGMTDCNGRIIRVGMTYEIVTNRPPIAERENRHDAIKYTAVDAFEARSR